MKILVTGGAGFIGSHLCEALLQEGHSVLCLDNLDPFYPVAIKRKNLSDILRSSPKKSAFTFIKADIRDFKKINAVLRSQKPTLVIHLAAKAGVRPSLEQPMLYADVNIKGTLNMLEACRLAGIKNFIFASSSSVYGNTRKIPFAESDTILEPISPYAATKKVGETLCHFYSHTYQMNIAMLRFFTAFGPRQRPDLAVSKFTKNILNGEPLPFYGDGSMRRDHTYIGDIIQGVLGASQWVLKKRSQPVCEAFNLGESRSISLKDLVRAIEKASGKKAKIHRLPVPKGDVRVTYADIRKAKKFFAYHPSTDLETGLKNFIQWYRSSHA